MPQIAQDGIITIGVPIYRSAALVEETLRSILAQSFQNFQVLMSVDGGDEDSAAVVRPYLADPRFRLTVHEEQLGWVGNLNWCMQQVRTEFYIYWQHDDLADPTYLASLLAAMHAHPEAAVTYCDVQQFGGAEAVTSEPPVTGAPLARVLDMLERPRWTPFRGLIRARHLAAIGPLRSLPHKSALEDMVWNARAAREGSLIQVAETLYRKRVHPDSLSTGWNSWEAGPRNQEVWINFGVGFLETLWPLCASAEARWDALAAVLERLVMVTGGRWMFSQPGALTDSSLRLFAQALLAGFRASPTIEGTLEQELEADSIEDRLVVRMLLLALARQPAAQSGWTSLRLTAPWTAFGHGHAEPAFRKSASGGIELRGAIIGGKPDPRTPIARLPLALAPRQTAFLLAASQKNLVRLAIGPKGGVWAYCDRDPGFISLDGLSYAND